MGSFRARIASEFSFFRGNYLVLVVSWVFLHFGFAIAMPYRSLFLRELGASPLLIGAIGSLGSAALLVATVLGAPIADAYGRRQIIVIMSYVAAFSNLFYAFAPDWRFAVLAVVLSEFSLIYHAAIRAIEADSLPPERRGMGYAMSHLVPHVPASISPTIGGILIATYGIVAGMRLAYIVVFLAFLLAATVRLYLKETLESAKRLRVKDVLFSFKGSFGSVLDVLKASSKELKYAILVSAIMYFVLPLEMMFVVLYVKDVVGVTEDVWGLVLTLSSAFSLAVGMPIGKLIDVFGRRRSLLLGYSLLALWTTMLVSAKDPLHLLLATLLLRTANSLIMPATGALQADMIPREKRGRLMGAISALGIAASLPSAAIGGYLYQVYPASPFLLVAIISLFSMSTVFFFVREPGRREV